MGNFLLRRLLLLIPVLWGVATLVFLLLHFIPGDPVDLMLGDSALGTDRETLRDQLGLNDPLIIQYFRYFGDLLQGDWGTSLFSKKPVFEEIMERVPATMELMLGAIVVTILVAMPLGLIAAVNKGTWIDQGAMIFSLLGVSIPNFWLGPMLILLFSIHFDLLPVNERGGLEHGSAHDPKACALSCGGAFALLRFRAAALSPQWEAPLQYQRWICYRHPAAWAWVTPSRSTRRSTLP